MAVVTFVLGLCGAGKSYYCERLSEETGAQVFEGVLQDPAKLDAIEQCLCDGKNCIVEEISYCIESYRNCMKARLSAIPDVEIKWVCLENDLPGANWNVAYRKNKDDRERHQNINASVHLGYTYPDGAEIIPITRVPRPLRDGSPLVRVEEPSSAPPAH